MCDLEHYVQLKNVQQGEVFNYSTILLKGDLANPRCGGKFRILADNSQSVPFSVAIEQAVGSEGESKQVIRKFRILLRLSPGEHQYAVQYCSTQTCVRLVYTAPERRFTVAPVYIICKGHSGRYQSSENDAHNDSEQACRKITLAIELLQCLYAEKLQEHGFGRKTFALEAPCRPFYSELQWAQSTTMTEDALWHRFAAELVHRKHHDMERVKVVGFLSSTHFEGISDGDYSYENIRKRTTGHAALGGGGLALFGTGCLYTWPSTLETVCDALLSEQPIDCAKLLDDSNYRRTYGGCFATTLGSVCHEMGHTFDLGHTPDGSIMGDGFDAIDNVFVGGAGGRALGANGPKRLIATKPGGLAGRLTQLKRPGEVLRQRLEAKQNDGVFFAPTSALTLSYHRWFNDARKGCGGGSINFDNTTRTVSCNGSSIVSVELRSTDSGMMQKCWTFQEEQQPRPISFTLPRLVNLPELTLFVVDTAGSILKIDLNSINQA
uniref:Uncharacterized protein n=1 Tax=Anopheles melas TaxID=34690 RepID=A0A182U412_9DIPT